MSRTVLLEGLGYLASALIGLSLMMRSLVRLRWINLVGSVCFAVYGVLIGAYPVAAINVALVGINGYFLERARRAREAFAVVEMPPDAPYLAEFLRFLGPEIRRFQPGFEFDVAAQDHVLVVLRDLVPAGVVVLRRRDARTADVVLDFVTPAYRDLKVGDYLFGRRRDLFRRLGVERLVTAPGSEAHAGYLERVGFERAGDGFVLDLVRGADVR